MKDDAKMGSGAGANPGARASALIKFIRPNRPLGQSGPWVRKRNGLTQRNGWDEQGMKFPGSYLS